MTSGMLQVEQTSSEIFDHIDTNADGVITRSEFNSAVNVGKPDEIFNHIDTNEDGLITRSEFDRAVIVQKPLPVESARNPVVATRVEMVKNYNIRDEIQLIVQSCFEAERKQLDHMISEKVDGLFEQLIQTCICKSSTGLERAFASLRQDFNTLRSDQSGYGEQLQQQVNALQSLHEKVDSQISDVSNELRSLRQVVEIQLSEVHRKNDVSMEMHAQTSVRLEKNHEDLCNLLEDEQKQRTQEIKELSESVAARFTEDLNRKSTECASQIQVISRRLDAEHADHAARMGRQQVWQAEIETATQELVTYLLELKEKHATLQHAFDEIVKEHSKKHKTSTNRHNELQLVLDSHQERWKSHSQNMIDDQNKITELRSLFDRLESGFEQGLRNQDKKLEDFRTNWHTERASLVKTMEEERATVRKAYDEHMRCLQVEHDARVRENREIRTDLSKGLADGRRVHQESHEQLEAMLNLKNQRRQDFFETEHGVRTLDAQQFHEKMATSSSNLENKE